jgi:hypothetical protein
VPTAALHATPRRGVLPSIACRTSTPGRRMHGRASGSRLMLPHQKHDTECAIPHIEGITYRPLTVPVEFCAAPCQGNDSILIAFALEQIQKVRS